MLKPLLQMYPVVIGFLSSARTATIRPPATSTRTPQLWLQSTQIVARSVASSGSGVRETEGSTDTAVVIERPPGSVAAATRPISAAARDQAAPACHARRPARRTRDT